MATALNMDRSRYWNPDMPVGYVKKEPTLRYTEGIEIDGVHYVWAPYIYDTKMEERIDFATLSDPIMTSDEECTIKTTRKGHESDSTALGASFSNIEIEEKDAKRKKKIKIKKECRRSGSSSSSSSHRHTSPTSSHKHTSPSRCKHGSPSSHRHRSPSPGGRRHHSPSSHRHRSISPTRKRHKVKQEYIKKEYYDDYNVKIKEEPLEPPEYLHHCSYHCSTCNITMNSLLTYNTHLNGKRHHKNMKVKNVPEAVAASIPATVISEDQSKYPKAPPGVIWRKVQKPAEIQEILENVIKQPCPGMSFTERYSSSTAPNMSASDYFCEICQCHMNSLQTWEAHIKGKRHLINLKKMPGDLPKTVLLPNKKVYLLERIKHERPHGEPFVGLKEIREIKNPKTKSHSYQCILCQSCHTSLDVMEHLMSLKHRTKYLESIEFHSRQVIEGMNDSIACDLVREMCRQVEADEGMGKPAVHVIKRSRKMYR